MTDLATTLIEKLEPHIREVFRTAGGELRAIVAKDPGTQLLCHGEIWTKRVYVPITTRDIASSKGDVATLVTIAKARLEQALSLIKATEDDDRATERT